MYKKVDLCMPIDARISMHSSFLSDLDSESVKRYFLDHDYSNSVDGCISITPRCALQGVPVDAFVAGRGVPMRRLEVFGVLFIRNTDPLTHTQIEAVKLILVYETLKDLPQLLHNLCAKLYRMTRLSKPLRQGMKQSSHLMAFRAIPGIGEKKAELLHREYGELRRLVYALRSGNIAQLLNILTATHIARLRTLFAVE